MFAMAAFRTLDRGAGAGIETSSLRAVNHVCRITGAEMEPDSDRRMADHPHKRGMRAFRAALLGASASLALAVSLAPAALAKDRAECPAEDCATATGGKADNRSASNRKAPEPNSERSEASASGAAMFSISVDGEHIAGTKAPADRQRTTDLGLDAVDVQVKFDGLEVKPFLNVSTEPVRRGYRSGETVSFRATANYKPFIEHAEVVIAKADDPHGVPVAVLPVDINGTADWVMPDGGEAELTYVLRVYDSKGRSDETEPLTIARTLRADDTKAARPAIMAGYGEDRARRRNIPVRGGAVTVAGHHVPPGYLVEVMGERIPVDANNGFVTQTILPAGEQDVAVAIRGGKGEDAEFIRTVNIPQNDWFYVALADITVGQRRGDAGIQAVRPGEFDGIYKKGRLAFYLKGKIKGKYLLTAAADTGEGELKSLFKGFDGKDARSLLRRLDPDDYYPVYGDDSSAVEDAPTRGKFYVRLERGDSHVMWGNYKVSIANTAFLRQQRALYGAQAVYRSEKTTSFGERRVEAVAYAAQPGTLPQRDSFRATGGSVYFLKHQDITAGSETVTVEVRDPITGQVIDRRTLVRGTDYEIDALQGVVVLKRPLASSTTDTGPVRDGTGGEAVHLVVQYEFTPAAGDVDGYVFGGRAQAWVDDHVRIGVTGLSEKTGGASQTAWSADVRIRKSEKTWIEAEYAQSHGPGFGSSISTDGGLSVSDTATAGVAGLTAQAWRVEGQADLAELSGGSVNGTIGAYYKERERGFATLSENVAVDDRAWGVSATVEFSERLSGTGGWDDYRDADGRAKQSGKLAVTYKHDEKWTVILGTTHTRLADPVTTKAGFNGRRTDIGARIEFRPDEDHLYYLFGQATVARAGDIRRNDRFGGGLETRLTEKLGFNGEVSYGTTGLGGLAALTYEPAADDRYYFGYRLDPDRTFDPAGSFDNLGRDYGKFVIGARRKMDERMTAFTEHQFDVFGQRRSLTQIYGVTYTPDALWTAEGSFEAGRIIDRSIDPVTGLERSDFDRKAVSASIGFRDEEKGLTARLRGEARFDRSDDTTRNVDAYFLGAYAGWKTSEDWRLTASLEAAVSDKTTTTILDGTWVEGSIGYAYRPVSNDRFNALVKYTYLLDIPGPDQVNANGDINGPAQRSHIFTADGIYDLTPKLSIGAKYGFRIGESRERGAAAWTRNDAHLGIVRLDFHVVKAWDAMIEGRALWSPTLGTVDYGALAAVYRHVGDNFKVGVGYNFGRFSDDLRDLTLDDRGWFFNLVGKF